MLGILDIILESGLEAEQASRVAQVRECTVGLLNLLNDILDFSKVPILQSGTHDLSRCLYGERFIFNVGFPP